MTGFLNVWVSIKISFNMLDLSFINKTETKAVPKGTLFLFIEIKVIVLHCNVKYRNLEKKYKFVFSIFLSIFNLHFGLK